VPAKRQRRSPIRDPDLVRDAVSTLGPVFTATALRNALTSLKDAGVISSRLSFDEFVDELNRAFDVRVAVLEPETSPKTELAHYKPMVRYVLGNASPYLIALSTKQGSYISHGSAAYLHALTDQVPKTIYVNKEQSAKPDRTVQLTQAGIDRAFANSPRLSNYTFRCGDFRVTLLSGKNTGRTEVTSIEDPEGAPVETTTLERTLVDVAVRPAYAGGPHQVLDIYKAARERASVNTVVAILRQLGHAYPFHQAVGFYLDKAGFPPDRVERLRAFGLHFDFYLANKLHDAEYIRDWRLYVPKGM
jgi:predicted transcriptional regulator of viral defense system